MTFARELRTIVASTGTSKHGKDLATVVDRTNPATKEEAARRARIRRFCRQLSVCYVGGWARSVLFSLLHRENSLDEGQEL